MTRRRGRVGSYAFTGDEAWTIPAPPGNVWRHVAVACDSSLPTSYHHLADRVAQV
jgi:hypothetical protein